MSMFKKIFFDHFPDHDVIVTSLKGQKTGIISEGKNGEFFLVTPRGHIFAFQQKLLCYSKCLGTR